MDWAGVGGPDGLQEACYLEDTREPTVVGDGI